MNAFRTVILINIPILVLAFIPEGIFNIGLIITEKPCHSFQFTCSNGECIEMEFRCDKLPQCSDNSDELDCGHESCENSHHIRCMNGTCVESSSLCKDYIRNIENATEGNFTDENHKIPGKCMQNNFKCLSDEICVHEDYLCDGHNDCNDGSDEKEGCALKKHCGNLEFMCQESKRCIPEKFRCDRKVDCDDRSDETHCEHYPIDLTNCTIKQDKFACHDKYTCISIFEVCDKKPDCIDGSDEGGLCERSECNNCTHVCQSTPTGGACLCKKGFLTTDDGQCQDVNECDDYGRCDQICINTNGSFYCACEDMYILQEDKRTCLIKGEEPVLLYSTMYSIKGVDLRTFKLRTYLENLRAMVGVSAFNNHIYWPTIDSGSPAIMKANEDDLKSVHTIVTNGLEFPEDLAVDWITENIYFTDNKLKHIVVCSSEGLFCTVLHTQFLDKPRSIVVVPKRGLLFWTDYGENPFIGRSGMDGSFAMAFVTTNIGWPNGLAVDEPNERVYWADAKLETIETIKMDQTDRRRIIEHSIKHPFGLEVFENKLYWSTWHGMEIMSCDKFTGANRTIVVRERNNKIYGIHLRHPLLEKSYIKNPCLHKKCSDLCLLAPSFNELSSSCACPFGKDLAADKMTCIEKLEPVTIVMGSGDQVFFIQHQRLGSHKLNSYIWPNFEISAMTYDSRKHVLLVADILSRGIYSYDLNSDSLEPFITHGMGPIGCMEFDDFGNNLYWNDKDTLSLEVLSLTTHTRKVIIAGLNKKYPVYFTLATEHGFMFVVMITLNSRTRIDRISMDGAEKTKKTIISFEKFSPDIKLIYSNELSRLFWIDSTDKSISSVNIEGSDIQKFFTSEPPYSFISAAGIIFWGSYRSSIINWHDYRTNEQSKNLRLNIDASKMESFLFAHIFNSRNDLSPCLINNGGCSHLCMATSSNGTRNNVCSCPIGTILSMDHLTCVQAKKCPMNYYQCSTGECIPSSYLCDRKNDCIQGDDESAEHCSEPRCPSKQFLCADNENCIDRNLKCNGHNDCEDGSDEIICHVNCTAGQFLCESGECIDIQFRCDGKLDCKRGYDEHNCAEVSCSTDHFRCSSGQCIPREWECDYDIDCVDESDELENCERKSCFSNEYRCTNDKCIDVKLTCNGVDDCGDDSDETMCRKSVDGKNHEFSYKLCNSKKNEFYCPSNKHHCIPISARCNGTKECVNGEDEYNCDSNPCIPGEQFYCKIDNICIQQQWVCDKQPDCSDGSDEKQDACLKKPIGDTNCSGFRCRNGECIQMSKVCDNIADCSDGSDETEKCQISCRPEDCSQTCFSTPVGPRCMCRAGYFLAADNITCEDINECDLNICSQNCTNTPGGYTCSCFLPKYQLRADHVSCKAIGESKMLVVASTDTVVLNSNNMKHTTKLLSSEIKSYDEIEALDVDNLEKHVFILLKDNTLVKITVGDTNQQPRIKLPEIDEFTIDWINKIIYFIANRDKICATSFENKWVKEGKLSLVQLHNTTSGHFYALAVDPTAGYLFWFEYNFVLPSRIGSVMRADGTGLNVINITQPLSYAIRQIIIDSWAGHLYWINQDTGTIQRMNYDGSRVETVFKSDNDIETFSFFQNSIYSVSQHHLTIRKCRIYGLPPQKCEVFKSNLHNIRHLTILQENRQRIVPNLCNKKNCSELCLLTPGEAQCVCRNGKILMDNDLCKLETTHAKIESPEGLNTSENTVSTYFAYFIIFCLFIGVVAFVRHNYKAKAKILHRLHFHKSTWDNTYSQNVYSSEKLIDSNEHTYENPPCNVSIETSKSFTYENETEVEKNKRLYLEALEEENNSYLSSRIYRSSKENDTLIKF